MSQLTLSGESIIDNQDHLRDEAWCRDLCMELLHSETEEQVVTALSGRGLWADDTLWRDFGDKEDNWTTIGNQQSRPEAALVEKVVNSVDARLLAECQASGVDPKSGAAPKSIREAVARFFEGRDVCGERDGRIREWDKRQRTQVSNDITVAATGEVAGQNWTAS